MRLRTQARHATRRRIVDPWTPGILLGVLLALSIGATVWAVSG